MVDDSIRACVLTSLPTVLFMSRKRSTSSRMSLAAFALENSSIIPLVVCINSPSSEVSKNHTCMKIQAVHLLQSIPNQGENLIPLPAQALLYESCMQKAMPPYWGVKPWEFRCTAFWQKVCLVDINPYLLQIHTLIVFLLAWVWLSPWPWLAPPGLDHHYWPAMQLQVGKNDVIILRSTNETFAYQCTRNLYAVAYNCTYSYSINL